MAYEGTPGTDFLFLFPSYISHQQVLKPRGDPVSRLGFFFSFLFFRMRLGAGLASVSGDTCFFTRRPLHDPSFLFFLFFFFLHSVCAFMFAFVFIMLGRKIGFGHGKDGDIYLALGCLVGAS